MAKYKVTTDNGKSYIVTTEDTTPKLNQQPVENTIEKPKTGMEQFKSMLGDKLKLPEKMSREGLGMLTEKLTPSREQIESGKVGVGGIAARTAGETLSEVAPSFVSPASIVTSGVMAGAKAALPLAKPLLSTIAKPIQEGAEKLSGLAYRTPDALKKVFERPSLFFGKGIENARKTYEMAKGQSPVRAEFQELMTKSDFVTKVMEAAKDGTATAEEALEGRKALDSIRKSLSDVGYRKSREVLDLIAKQKFAEADKIYQDAIVSEAIRTLAPFNKTGSPSIVKMTLGGFKPLLIPFMSPVGQGLIASGLGLTAKTVSSAVQNPELGALVGVMFGNNFTKALLKRDQNLQEK